MACFACDTNTLEKSVANRLLDLLSTDDSYRELFVKDVVSALTMIGHTVPSEVYVDGYPVAGPGGCWIVTSLASKEQIRNGRAKLEQALGLPFSFRAPPPGLQSDYKAD